jgi:hypothetical protein
MVGKRPRRDGCEIDESRFAVLRRLDHASDLMGIQKSVGTTLPVKKVTTLECRATLLAELMSRICWRCLAKIADSSSIR